MKAIIKHPGESTGHIEDIPNTLEALQQAVGGYIEPVTLITRRNICIICDEEGRIRQRPLNCIMDGVDFVGTILVVGVDGDEFTDCPLSLEEWEGMLS